jgi:hypothetical protein
LLAPVLFCWSETAPAQSGPPASAEELLAAYNERIHDAMGSVDGARRCPREAQGDDAIVVCGRSNDSRMRLPLPVQPEPGTRHRLIAGETPSARDAMDPDRCLRLCYQPVTMPIIPAIRALGSGLDRLLHPD